MERELVLTTRLVVPPVPPGMVARPRVSEKLSADVERPLTLVVAPAGSGKTALLSSWAAAPGPRAFACLGRARPGGLLAAALLGRGRGCARGR